jgi:hypothetical protein
MHEERGELPIWKEREPMGRETCGQRDRLHLDEITTLDDDAARP